MEREKYIVPGIDNRVIYPVNLQDALALWMIARQQGVSETMLALSGLRLEQHIFSLL